MTTYNEMKQEAVERMKYLKLHDNVVKEFSEEGKLNKSEHAMLFWLTPEEAERVETFEHEYNCIVYHVIHNNDDEIGDMYSYLYVSNSEQEWPDDRADLQNGIILCYVDNITYPDCSEFGSIGIKPAFGGLLRTC